MHNIYDFNVVYQGFVSRFGIEPNGILMNEFTFQLLKTEVESIITIEVQSLSTFMGVKIFRSEDLENGKCRFII